MNNSLIYKPLYKSILQNESEELEQEPIIDWSIRQMEETSFPVEPVRDWTQPSDFNWNIPKPDNYIGERVPPKGRVYKASEKDEFKTDMLNAYTNALKERGLEEDLAKRFAKRIVAQDALESTYGQSGLSKYYNFGGIKDFRTDSDSLKLDTKEHDGKKFVVKKQPFRKFKDLEEYVNYKIDLLGNSNYDVFSYAPEKLYKRLTSAKKKYATDPNYESKLNWIYNLLWGNER